MISERASHVPRYRRTLRSKVKPDKNEHQHHSFGERIDVRIGYGPEILDEKSTTKEVDKKPISRPGYKQRQTQDECLQQQQKAQSFKVMTFWTWTNQHDIEHFVWNWNVFIFGKNRSMHHHDE